MEKIDKSTIKINWKEIAFFYLLAITISVPFRLGFIYQQRGYVQAGQDIQTAAICCTLVRAGGNPLGF